MNETQTRKVKLNVKGKLRNRVHRYFANKKARKVGVVSHELQYANGENVEIFMEGSKSEIWTMVNWHKRGPILCSVSEVDLEFLE